LTEILGADAPPIVSLQLDPPHLMVMLARLVIAFLLGLFIAHRPWRRLFGRRAARIAPEIAQAQTILTVAGALMVAVVGDSLARAFGLVGLGTFIRFRATIRDPRDVVVLLVAIAVGMACGLGFIPTAVVGTVFAATILAFFDRLGRVPQQVLKVTVQAEDPDAALSAVRREFPQSRVIELPRPGNGPGRIVLEILCDPGDDAATLLARLQHPGTVAIKALRIGED
jgi:uncharacterized membrane protein YhiD involved in acid resistance